MQITPLLSSALSLSLICDASLPNPDNARQSITCTNRSGVDLKAPSLNGGGAGLRRLIYGRFQKL